MCYLVFICFIIGSSFSAVFAQKSNDAIAAQIKSLKADKTITLIYDAPSNTSKLMIRADNFLDSEANKAGIQAMNFGMAFFYTGTVLQTPPETLNLTFWVLTKKPQFATANKWIVKLTPDALDLGDARYAAKPGESMEYLNFKINRTDLAKIAGGTGVKFRLGTADFTFTAEHIAIFKNILAILGDH